MYFFFNDTATTEIYTLSLHDALPISSRARPARQLDPRPLAHREPAALDPRRHLRRRPLRRPQRRRATGHGRDRKSTRLNSSHANISYAVFCLKKKNIKNDRQRFSLLS